MMTITDNVITAVKRLQISGNGAHGYERGAFNAAQIIFPLLANIDEQKVISGLSTSLQFRDADFKFAHCSMLWLSGLQILAHASRRRRGSLPDNRRRQSIAFDAVLRPP